MRKLISVGLLTVYADEPWNPEWIAPQYGKKQNASAYLETTPKEAVLAPILCTKKKEGVWICSNQTENH